MHVFFFWQRSTRPRSPPLMTRPTLTPHAPHSPPEIRVGRQRGQGLKPGGTDCREGESWRETSDENKTSPPWVPGPPPRSTLPSLIRTSQREWTRSRGGTHLGAGANAATPAPARLFEHFLIVVRVNGERERERPAGKARAHTHKKTLLLILPPPSSMASAPRTCPPPRPPSTRPPLVGAVMRAG